MSPSTCCLNFLQSLAFLTVWVAAYRRSGSDTPLPAGSVVIAHSGLLHGRRQMPGGDVESPRYFTDVCYAQHSRSGRLWESYQLKKQPGGRDDEAAEGGIPPHDHCRYLDCVHPWPQQRSCAQATLT